MAYDVQMYNVLLFGVLLPLINAGYDCMLVWLFLALTIYMTTHFSVCVCVVELYDTLKPASLYDWEDDLD